MEKFKNFIKEFYVDIALVQDAAREYIKAVNSDATEEEENEKLFDLVAVCNKLKEFIID